MVKESGHFRVLFLAVLLSFLAAFSVYAGTMKGEPEGWRYYQEDGSFLVDRWFQDDQGKRYHFNEKGYADVGWVKIDRNTYFMDYYGVMQTGWIVSDRKYYYLGTDGAMCYNITTPDGYFVGEQGYWKPGERREPDQLRSVEFYGTWLFAPTALVRENGYYVVTGIFCDNGFSTEGALEKMTEGSRIFLPWTSQFGDVKSNINIFDKHVVTVVDDQKSQFQLSRDGMSVTWGNTAGYPHLDMSRFQNGYFNALYVYKKTGVSLVIHDDVRAGYLKRVGAPNNLLQLLTSHVDKNLEILEKRGSNLTNRFAFLAVHVDGDRILEVSDWPGNELN